MILNGSLAGLVGITAGADCISPMNSVIVGFIAGIIVVISVIQFDKIKIDDPVGAISVHLVCGIWGTLAVGIFSPEYQLGVQALGVASYGIFCFVGAAIIFQIIKLLLGLRVSEEEEIIGLDIGEHDMESYAGFQIFTVE
jgi:Amt family ammonium transporter